MSLWSKLKRKISMRNLLKGLADAEDALGSTDIFVVLDIKSRVDALLEKIKQRIKELRG